VSIEASVHYIVPFDVCKHSYQYGSGKQNALETDRHVRQPCFDLGARRFILGPDLEPGSPGEEWVAEAIPSLMIYSVTVVGSR
jgi:hypothetical protein